MLNHRQKLFAKYFVELGFHATKAAKLAGYSKASAYELGSRLLKNVEIQAEIKRHIAIREQKMNVTDKRIIEELAMIGFSDPRDYYGDDGELLPIQELSKMAAKALAEFTVTQCKDGSTVTKIKRENKLKALETLARIRTMFKDDDQSVSMRERIIYYPVKVAEGAKVDLTAHLEKPVIERRK